MELLSQEDEQRILNVSKTGLFRAEFENGAMVRLYGDAMMYELLGIREPATPEECLKFFDDRIHPDDRELFLDYVKKLSESRTEIIYRYIHPVCGEMVIRCGGVMDQSADPVYLLGTHQDISDMVRLEQERWAERRLAEKNLSLRKEQVQQEHYYRDLLDVQNCGLLVYTLPGHKIMHMNAEALRMYHVKDIQEMQDELGTVLFRIYYPDPETIKQLRRLRDVDETVDYECVLNKGHEHECHIMAKTKAIRMPNGERASVTTFLDVSDMVMLRNALRQAEEGSRAKSAFLFAMSHDLRTPMNAIIGYADLIDSRWGQEAVCREYLRKLKEASRFLLALIGNVLEVSRIESGNEELHEHPWDLRNLAETLEILEGDIAKKKLQVTSRINLPRPYALCDETKLREIVMNLLSNAVKYTPEGGEIELLVEEITGKTELSQEEDIRLRIMVSDNGIGIAESYLPHLFEAFSRERDSSESGIMGTGLGLQIVKSFAELMGGTASVTSTQGAGSCFTVEVLLKPADEADCKKPLVSEQLSLEGKRVLLAEDNVLNAEITATVLGDVGVLVDLAENGKAALEQLQAVPEEYYDLILMDIQMPHMNGYEASKAIRALPDKRSETMIIAMTANAFEEDRKAAFAAGMDGYISKPVEAEKLRRGIAEALHEREETKRNR